MESEVTIGASTYRVNGIDAWTQFHIVRRLFPILAALAGAAKDARPPSALSAGQAELSENSVAMAGVAAMAGVLSTMKDDDCDFVIRACLKACQKRQGDAWSQMLNANGHMMFGEATSLSDLLQLTSAVLQRQEGLVAFFQGLQSPADAQPSLRAVGS